LALSRFYTVAPNDDIRLELLLQDLDALPRQSTVVQFSNSRIVSRCFPFDFFNIIIPKIEWL
jgi:hypothetical protein